MLASSHSIHQHPAGDKGRPVAPRRGRNPSHRKTVLQPDLFEAAGEVLRIDASQVGAWAKGIWAASMDARVALLCERWLSSCGLALPDGVDGSVLRFHPSLKFDDERAPGLVWLMRDVRTDEPTSILRVFLDEGGVEIARRPLGRVFATAVKLDADENVSGGLHIATSIETGLAAMAQGYCPLWVVLASALAEFAPLPGIEAITFLTSGDDGARAVAEAAARWMGAGREVILAPPLRPP